MRLFEVDIREAPVDSTWIKDLNWTDNGAILTNSKDVQYFIDMPKEMFDRWFNSDSKGEFFHQFVKNNYEIKRG